MTIKTLEAKHNGLNFRIEEDFPDVGAYLYIYENEKCIYDFLQDSIEICKEQAFEDFSVPLDKWVEKEKEI